MSVVLGTGETYKLFMTFEEADDLAMLLNKEEEEAGDDWSYEAVRDPKGSNRAVVNVYDSENEFIGRL